MWQALPELPCDDVAAAVAWSRDVLGFHSDYQQHDLGVMDRDGISVLLIARTDQNKGIGSCEVNVSDALDGEKAGDFNSLQILHVCNAV
jgi:catechol 2,3-dioxygenase-like lactoylglutathione lyase family enzyme